MPNTLIHSYDTLFDAESAQQQLVAAGFPRDCIHLTVTQEEAGPVQGNFTVGDGGSFGTERADNVPSGLNNSEIYARDYKEVANRGQFLVTVDAGDDDQERRASEILNRYGGIDVQEVSGRATRH